MTEPTTRELPRLEYEGDPTHSLRVPELRLGNQMLSRTVGHAVDLLDAITAPTEYRWDAMAYVGWLIHKRQDPQAQLAIWTGATVGQLADALRQRAPAERADAGEDDAAATPTLEGLEEAARLDPTETPPSPSSPPAGEA